MIDDERSRRRGYRLLGGCIAVLVFVQAAPTLASTIVRFATVLGNIDVRMYDQAKPLSVANFLGYVNRGDYEDVMIHRSEPGFVIQGGRWTYNGTAQVEPQNYPQVPQQSPVLNEPGISNIRGTIAFAKLGPPQGQPPTPETINSATREWFFNLSDTNASNLDNQNGGFTVFGRVLGNGMAVADQIAALPRFGFQGAWNRAPMRNYTVQEYNAFVPVNGENVVRMDIFEMNVAPGDFNFDGVVNAADYTVWRNTFGLTTNAAADGNGDGIVDLADHSVWRNTLGMTGASLSSGAGSSVAVPEPTSVGLVGIVFLLICAGRRKLRSCT